MAFLGETYVNGPLLVKESITLTDKDIHIASLSKGNILLGDKNYPMSVSSKGFGLASGDDIGLYSDRSIDLHSKDDTTLYTDHNLVFKAKAIVLQNSSDNCLYGTADPNDLVLPNVQEGTLYFKLAIE